MKKFIFFMVLTLGVAMSAGEVIKLKFGNIQTLVDMEESETSKEFIAMLPLSLKFSDYANKEKIASTPVFPVTFWANLSQLYSLALEAVVPIIGIIVENMINKL